MAHNKYAKFFALLKQANTNGLELTKEQAILEFTKGKTSSLSDLSAWELQEMERGLASVTSPVTKATGNKAHDAMRKAIISQFLSIGRTAEDAIHWAETKGVFGKKRAFNDYTGQELYQLIRNAEHVKADAIEAINRKYHQTDGI